MYMNTSYDSSRISNQTYQDVQPWSYTDYAKQWLKGGLLLSGVSLLGSLVKWAPRLEGLRDRSDDPG